MCAHRLAASGLNHKIVVYIPYAFLGRVRPINFYSQEEEEVEAGEDDEQFQDLDEL